MGYNMQLFVCKGYTCTVCELAKSASMHISPDVSGHCPSSPLCRHCIFVCAPTQVVVEDDRVGLDLVRLLNKAGRGRVTFMPLNRLHVPDIAYPTQFKQDAVPLHKLLKCPDQYKKAVQQVTRCFLTLIAAHPTSRYCPMCMCAMHGGRAVSKQ